MENILGKVTSVEADENGLYVQLEPSEEGKHFFRELLQKEKEQTMTCREKLKLEHPDAIDTAFLGGCSGCPSRYGYLNTPNYCQSNDKAIEEFMYRIFCEGKISKNLFHQVMGYDPIYKHG